LAIGEMLKKTDLRRFVL